MVLNRGWSHTIYRYHISSCMWSDTGSERDNETNVDSWRTEFRAFRPARDIYILSALFGAVGTAKG